VIPVKRGPSDAAGDTVAAPAISLAMARSIERYVADVAPDQPFGYLELDRKLRTFSL
jgi:hypothetical protein